MIDDYASVFDDAAKQYNVDPRLLRAIAHVESNGDPRAVSDQGAQGLMQLMPETASSLGVENPNDPKQAIYGAAKLINENLTRYGTAEDAVRAYHGGTDQKNWGPKTQHYLTKVMDAYQTTQPADLSDDALLSQYGEAAPAQVQGVSDDDLLKQYAADEPAAAAAGDPAPGMKITITKRGAKQVTPVDQSNPESTASLANKLMMPIVKGAADFTGALPALREGAEYGLGDEPYSLARPLVAGYDAATGNNANDTLNTEIALRNADYEKLKAGNPIAAPLGRLAGEVVGSAPALAGGEAALASGMNALKLSLPQLAPYLDFAAGRLATGNKLMQYGSKALGGGETGVATTALTSAGNDMPVEDQMKQNAGFGAVLGGGAPMLYDAGRGTANMLTGGGTSPEVANLVKLAKEKYGIDLYGPQIGNSQFTKYLDSTTGKVPLSGAGPRIEKQHQQFSDAVASTFGAKDLTQQGMNAARKNIRGMYNSVADNTAVVGDAKLKQGLSDVAADAAQTDVGPKLDKIIENINNKFDANGVMSGTDYKSITAKGTPLDRLMQSSDPNVRFYAGQIGDHLDAALARAAKPEDLQTLVTADRYWKNMKTVENLAAKGNAEGSVSPVGLRGAVIKSFKDYAYTGGGELGELAKIGQFMKEPPSSGTAERIVAYGSTMFPMERLMQGDVEGAGRDLMAGAGIVGGARLTQNLLNSSWYRNRLLNSAKIPGLMNPLLNSGASVAIPGAAMARNAFLSTPVNQ